MLSYKIHVRTSDKIGEKIEEIIDKEDLNASWFGRYLLHNALEELDIKSLRKAARLDPLSGSQKKKGQK